MTPPSDAAAAGEPLARGASTSPPAGEAAQGRSPAGLAYFLASLGHDLRSPLNILSAALSDLGDPADQTSADRGRITEMADRCLLRLARFADLVSLAAALEPGSFEPARSTVDLLALLRAVPGSAAELHPRREVTITCEIPEGTLPALVDPRRLSLALVEITINAVRFAYRNVRLRCELAGGEARITIEDDGMGVAPQHRATLFQRFVPRPPHSGLGLGLSLAHDVIAAHGGRLELEDSTLSTGRPNTIGAAFVAILPIARAS